jgi:hypothetical protein
MKQILRQTPVRIMASSCGWRQPCHAVVGGTVAVCAAGAVFGRRAVPLETLVESRGRGDLFEADSSLVLYF